MSATINPDPDQSAPAFIPLEANPQLMTSLAHRLGVSPALALHDVYSLTDPDLLAFIPRPALALLLVFPVSAAYESHRMAEDAIADEYKGKGEGEPVVWWRQTIRNACGMMGLLHAVSNGPAREFIGKPSRPLLPDLQKRHPPSPLDDTQEGSKPVLTTDKRRRARLDPRQAPPRIHPAPSPRALRPPGAHPRPRRRAQGGRIRRRHARPGRARRRGPALRVLR